MTDSTLTQSEVMNPEDFFSPWEHQAQGWDECLKEINELIKLVGARRELVWRGVSDSSYALHSSLYRRFIGRNKNPPEEEDLVLFEMALLDTSRKRWRFDDLSALETLAHIQHYGGPTRLLDVSYNPLVALWFAVEEQRDQLGEARVDNDGRLFAFDATDRRIDLDSTWGQRELPWRRAPNGTWNRGLPVVWRPPSYNVRIPAQNSAFLIGGVPQVGSGENSKYRKGPGDGSQAGIWNIDQVRRATSVVLSMTSLDRTPQILAKPTFTIRIGASSKREVRQALEEYYGFNASTIYPDLYGLARYGANEIDVS